MVGLAAAGPARCVVLNSQPQRSAGQLNGAGALSVADLAFTLPPSPDQWLR